MDASQKQEAIKVLSDPETVKKVTEKAFADIDTDHSGFTERGEPAKACKPLSKECGAPEKNLKERIRRSYCLPFQTYGRRTQK